jgi:DNA invertase Pin-like site-specific DNA recombinase
MNQSAKIQPQHLTRAAVVYVRQSTPKQVQLNQESTRRQYQLVERAHALGWPQSLIQVIDDDLGLSGASSDQRLGFQRLVAAISLGQIGMVLVTEVSRLSRLNSDWHRVIELCAVFQTLIADEDGIYDLRDPNDRLLLGLKGTLFSAELHILRARMHGNLLNKARRGELALQLPVGYRRQKDGTVIREPDEQVRHTLTLIFTQFTVLKSARAVQRYFAEHHLLMPRLIRYRLDEGQLHWVTPTYQMIQQVLTNPVYAGVFVYGRRKTTLIPGDPPRTHLHRLPADEWEIVIPDIYPAYLSYDQYRANRQTLHDNLYNFEKKGSGAPRDGRGLLQGILICGRCGRHLTPSYSNDYQAYVCRREQITYDRPPCQVFPARYLDEALSAAFLQAVQPAQLELTLAALEHLEQEQAILVQQWTHRLERARYQAQLAQRQYDAVDPDHRLVAAELEKRWNEALLAVRQLEQDYAVVQCTELSPLTDTERQMVRQLATDLPALWQAPTTSMADRKRLLRVLIQEVTVTTHPETRSATAVILWSGGATTTQEVTCPPLGWHCVTDPAIVQRIRDLAQSEPDHRIAERLNAEGLQTRTGKAWTYQRVQSMRKQYQIPTTAPVDPTTTSTRSDGLVSANRAAQLLKISPTLVNLWAKQGVLMYDQRTAGSYLWVQVTDQDCARLDGSQNQSHLPTVQDYMRAHHLTRDQVWQLVQAGQLVAYRQHHGQAWEWRLAQGDHPQPSVPTSTVVTDQKGTSDYE